MDSGTGADIRSVTEISGTGNSTNQFPNIPSESPCGTIVSDNECKVCLVARRNNTRILVPCGHAMFCESCLEKVYEEGLGCLIC